MSHEEVEPSVVLLEAEVAADDVDRTFNQVYHDFSKQIRLPGFRKGKVPREILQLRLGRETIRQETVNRLAQSAYEAALSQSGLNPIEQVSFEVVKIEEASPFRFKTKLVTKPQVLLGEYGDLRAERPQIEITEEMVSEQLEILRARHARHEPIGDRGLREGDVVWGTLMIATPGPSATERTSRVQPFIIGNNGMVPNLDQALVGHREGDVVETIVTYPDDFPDKELAGKSAVARFVIEGCRERKLPEMDDNFAAQVGDFSSLQELKEEIARSLERQELNEALERIEADLVRQVVDRSVVTVPEVLIARRAERRMAEIEERLKERQVTLDEYLESLNSSLDDLREKVREQVLFEIKRQHVLEEIAAREQIVVSEEELSEYLRIMAKSLRESPAALRRRLEERGALERIRSELQADKAARLLLERSGALPEPGQPDKARAVVSPAHDSDNVEGNAPLPGGKPDEEGTPPNIIEE